MRHHLVETNYFPNSLTWFCKDTSRLDSTSVFWLYLFTKSCNKTCDSSVCSIQYLHKIVQQEWPCCRKQLPLFLSFLFFLCNAVFLQQFYWHASLLLHKDLCLVCCKYSTRFNQGVKKHVGSLWRWRTKLFLFTTYSPKEEVAIDEMILVVLSASFYVALSLLLDKFLVNILFFGTSTLKCWDVKQPSLRKFC